jgi:hypothetical protein
LFLYTPLLSSSLPLLKNQIRRNLQPSLP